MTSPPVRIFLLPVFLAVAFIATIIIISNKQSATIKNSFYWVQHTQEILYNSEKILLLIANYQNVIIDLQINKTKAINPQSQYLKNEINKKLIDFKKLVIDNNVQQLSLNDLSLTIEKKIGATNAISFFRNNTSLDDKQKNILKNDSFYTNEIKRIVSTIQVAEEKLLIV